MESIDLLAAQLHIHEDGQRRTPSGGEEQTGTFLGSPRAANMLPLSMMKLSADSSQPAPQYMALCDLLLEACRALGSMLQRVLDLHTLCNVCEGCEGARVLGTQHRRTSRASILPRERCLSTAFALPPAMTSVLASR